VGGSGISWAMCKSAPRSRQITTVFTGRMPFLLPNQQHQSIEGKYTKEIKKFSNQTENPDVKPKIKNYSAFHKNHR